MNQHRIMHSTSVRIKLVGDTAYNTVHCMQHDHHRLSFHRVNTYCYTLCARLKHKGSYNLAYGRTNILLLKDYTQDLRGLKGSRWKNEIIF